MNTPYTPALPAEFGPLVDTCAEYGIRRNQSFELVRDGLLDTFTIGKKRFVWRESLRTLPARLAQREAA
jgi:hypothetical protein